MHVAVHVMAGYHASQCTITPEHTLEKGMENGGRLGVPDAHDGPRPSLAAP